MTNAKTATPAKTKTAPPDDEWSECSGCFRLRRSPGGLLCEHNAWYGLRIAMQPCPGSRQPSAEAGIAA
jgi:hypothetical protein